MKYKKVKERYEIKRPLIVPWMYYIFGSALIIEILYLIIISPPDSVKNIIAAIFMALIFGGLGTLFIIVGYRRRKW